MEESIGVDNKDVFNGESDLSYETSDESDQEFEPEEKRQFKKEIKWEAAFMGMYHRGRLMIPSTGDSGNHFVSSRFLDKRKETTLFPPETTRNALKQ